MTRTLSVDPVMISARLRDAGQAWKCGRRTAADRSALAATFTAMLETALCAGAAAQPVTPQEAALAAGRLVDALLAEMDRPPNQPPAQEIAADLLSGRQVRADVALDETYVVAVVRAATEEAASGLRALLPGLIARNVLIGPARGDVVLLVPADSGKAVRGTLLDLSRMAPDVWIAVAGARPRCEAPAGLEEAREVLRVTVAGRREPGVFSVADVLLDYAVAGNKEVTAELAEIVRPVADKPTLWATLLRLIDADFNRNEAARALVVHRSTLDYRVGQIARLTGHDPNSGRGAQVLSAAATAYGLMSGR